MEARPCLARRHEINVLAFSWQQHSCWFTNGGSGTKRKGDPGILGLGKRLAHTPPVMETTTPQNPRFHNASLPLETDDKAEALFAEEEARLHEVHS